MQSILYFDSFSLDDGMTLDSYLEEGRDETALFGADILQDFQLRRLECHMNISRTELRYQTKRQKLLKYHHQMEKVMKAKNFEQMTNQTRPTVKQNLQKTLQAMEREHLEKRRKNQRICDMEIDAWLGDKLKESVKNAQSFISQDFAMFTDFLRKVHQFKSKLVSHRAACFMTRRRLNSTITCHPRDLELLIEFTSVLIVELKYIGDESLSDDEDFGIEGHRSGSGDLVIEPEEHEREERSTTNDNDYTESTPQASELAFEQATTTNDNLNIVKLKHSRKPSSTRPTGNPKERHGHGRKSKGPSTKSTANSQTQSLSVLGGSTVIPETRPAAAATADFKAALPSDTTFHPPTSKEENSPTNSATEILSGSNQQVAMTESEGKHDNSLSDKICRYFNWSLLLVQSSLEIKTCVIKNGAIISWTLKKLSLKYYLCIFN